MKLKNKNVIVTGAASGIGLATAKRFAEEGCNVAIADLSYDRANEVAHQLAAEFKVKTLAVACDVSREDQVTSAVDGVIRAFGSVDVVVNNAGLMVFKPIEELESSDFLRVLNVDLLGAFYFTRECFRKMKNGGAIVNVSSIHAVETTPLVSAYAAAKAALLSFTRSSALEGKSKNIRVNAILPGAVDTPMLWENPNVKAGLEKIDRADVGKPEDLAAVIAFLASDDAAFVQGASITVDGGRLGKL